MRRLAEERGVGPERVVEEGLERKAEEFRRAGGAIYQPAPSPAPDKG